MSESPAAPPGEWATFVDLLRDRATRHPARRVYTFLAPDGSEERVLTYGALDELARAVAAQLQRLAAPGDRALLVYPSGLDFVVAFYGCLYAGVIAVPALPEAPRPNRPASRLRAIADDAGATVALTTARTLPTLVGQAIDAPDGAALRWLATDEVGAAGADDWEEPRLDGASLAFLQYTSGSTGTPRGVMVSHANLLHNERMVQLGMAHDERTVQIGWLPLFHDMGLIGNVLQPLYVGGECVLMAPTTFVQQPFRWLEAISRYRGTTSGGPNFAYDLCARAISPAERATLDLSSWRVAFNGAEPVRPATLANFAEVFAASGFRSEAFYPCYGLAEATLFVTGGVVGALPTVRSFDASALEQNEIVAASAPEVASRALVGCGQTWDVGQILIVDPDSCRPCPPDQVGEVWVAGPHVAGGYWRRAEETAETFLAFLATGEGPFLRTGDLGCLRDGELFITGRRKDLIIIRGRNHYPQDIEQTAERSHPALRPGAGAAFADDEGGEERLVIVQELDRRSSPADAEAAITTIRRRVAEEHGLQPGAILLVRAATVPKTSSGKIQRRACRAAYRARTLAVVSEWATPIAPVASGTSLVSGLTTRDAESITAWLVARLAVQLGFAPESLDIHLPFAAQGLDSLRAVQLAGALGEWLGRPVPVTLAWTFPTISTLAHHLADTTAHPAVAVRSGDPGGGAEPVAVLGIGCRFPGAAGPDAFWSLLRDGIDAVTEVPPERWDVDAFYDPELATAGTMNTRWGGFLADVDKFDPRFFGVSADEAAGMDPQQRLLLETSWEALEHAGVAPDRIAGSDTGVFIGIATADYYRLMRDPPARGATGVANSVAANRLSYFLDLHGPSLAVDTACSSSLVAVDLACRSLRSGGCELALAGGVNLILAADTTLALSQAGFMAPDGRCKSFDAEANGYVRAEGCGVLVLKRLADARRDGDQILAVLRGSAVTHNGRSNGLTAPSVPAQEAVIRRALAEAGVAPGAIDYVEAHGSGTTLGDLIETQALQTTLGAGRPPHRPCALGSVKTNIGHAEAAAGIAGLIKTILALRHEEIPPHLHLRALDPRIAAVANGFTIPTAPRPWLAGARPRLAGVSSFGFGGANAHLIVEEAPPPPPGEPTSGPRLLALSARDDRALRRLAIRHADWLAAHPDTALADFCWSANSGRVHFARRLALVADSTEQLRDQLAAFAAGDQPDCSWMGTVPRAGTPGTNGSAAAHSQPVSPGTDGRMTILESTAARYVAGETIDWGTFDRAGTRRITLPTYPFERQRCWLEPAAIREYAPARAE